MPPPGKQATGVSLQQIRITDKRGEHTIPVQFDAGVPLQGGKAAAYLWRSFLDTNGPISIEADGTASTFAPPPVGSGMESFSVSCSCESENLTVVSVTNDSDLAQWGLVAFSPDSATHSVTATLADAPDPHGPASDKGSVSVGLHSLGRDGLGSLAWSANWPSEQLGQGGEYTGSLVSPPNIPLIYAPNAGTLQVDEDSHSWYSQYVWVSDLDVWREAVTGCRTMRLGVTHRTTLADSTPPSDLTAVAISAAPVTVVATQGFPCSEGLQTQPFHDCGPFETSGAQWLVMTGTDGHGSASKYAGAREQPIEPAMISFSLPSATTISGCENNGGFHLFAWAKASGAWSDLGWVDQPLSPPEQAQPASEACFYAARYVYGQGVRGGYIDRPGKDQTLEALFSDSVVIYCGHGDVDVIQNQLGDASVTSADIQQRRTEVGHESPAKLAVLDCCYAGTDSPDSVANALISSGVDCVIGYTGWGTAYDPGYNELVELLCDEGMDTGDAYRQVCANHRTWATSTRLAGSTTVHLWGVPL